MRPRFIILGAAKAGTSSLFNYLAQHPEVCVPYIKETRFFAFPEGQPPRFKGYGPRGQQLMDSYPRSIPSNWQAYQALYDPIPDGFVTGEASPAYLYFPEAAGRIHDRFPEARLIAILRDPVERAYSSYLHMRRENAEIDSFEEALRLESERIRENAGLPYRYADMGRYARQLEPFLDKFGPDSVLVISYGDWGRNAPELFRRICRHLRIDEEFEPDRRERKNISGIPRRPRLYQRLRRALDAAPAPIRRPLSVPLDQWLLERPPLPVAAVDYLREQASDEANRLAKLLGRPWSF